MLERNYNWVDQMIIRLDRSLAAVRPEESQVKRASPAAAVAEVALDEKDRQLAGALMRVNHAGEVSAQALYQGQALAARDLETQSAMRHSAGEEADHLDWCKQRLEELGDRPSLLDPVWYLGSFMLGALAGLAGDKWSLGFIAETEHQVVEHLQDHLARVPGRDGKTRAILQQMAVDEARHGASARRRGGMELPAPVKQAMKFASRIMTRTAYWI